MLKRSVVLLVLLAGCGPSQVRQSMETNAVGLPKPPVVYVYDFAVQPSEVQLDTGGPLARLRGRLSGGGGDSDQDDEAIQLGHQVANGLADALVQKIAAMGLTAQRAARGQEPPAEGLAVTGQFVDVDEGNRARRMAIGFHQGQSSVSAQVQVHQAGASGRAAELLSFVASAQSPPVPGAVVTMGAGAAVQAAAASSKAAGAATGMGATVQDDADRLAAQVADYLQQFFAKQGWAAPPSDLPAL